MSVSKFKQVMMVTLCCVASLFRCTGIETTNGVTLVASSTSIEGSVPPHTIVSLYDTGYVPFIDSGVARTVTAGESGIVAFNDLLPGRYNAVVCSPDRRNAAFISRIAIDDSGADSQYRATLEPVGSISGAITGVPDTVPEVIAYLHGTAFYTRVPGNAAFTIDRVPAGDYALRIAGYLWSNTVDRNPKIQSTLPIEVTPEGDTKAGTIVFVP